MDFFIKKGATKPILKLELIQDGRNDYRNFYDLLQNASIRFSMYDAETGVKQISKKLGGCMLKPSNCDTDDEEYYLVYEWKEKDTKKAGTYIGEFTITFLEDNSILKVPIREDLYIHVREGQIKK